MRVASLLRATAVGALSLFAAGTTFPGAANANLVLGKSGAVQTPADAFFDLGAQGFGTAPRLLTLQTSGVETGNVTPVDVVHGDAVPGANKSTTPTLATLGWDAQSVVIADAIAIHGGGFGVAARQRQCRL